MRAIAAIAGLSIKSYIGVGRFRIFGGGGQGLEYWGGGARWRTNSQQAHDVVTTSCAH